MCSSRLDLRLDHFKAFVAVSLLGVFITILPTHFCRVSRLSLFTSPQYPQTPAKYSKVGLIIDKKKMALALIRRTLMRCGYGLIENADK